jgi:hypothetical protein
MTVSLENQKLYFLSKISKDKIVQDLGTDGLIRELLNKMISYVHEVNGAYTLPHSRHKQRMIDRLVSSSTNDEDIGFVKNFVSGQDNSPEPVILDFKDISDIAYTIATYVDNRNMISRFLMSQHPLDQKVKEYADMYRKLIRTGNIEPGYFEPDVREDILSLNRPINAGYVMNRLYKKAAGHMDRVLALQKLADSSDLVTNSLSINDAKTIAGYFSRHAVINGVLFKAISYMCSKKAGIPYPERNAQLLYKGIIDGFYGRRDYFVIQTK